MHVESEDDLITVRSLGQAVELFETPVWRSGDEPLPVSVGVEAVSQVQAGEFYGVVLDRFVSGEGEVDVLCFWMVRESGVLVAFPTPDIRKVGLWCIPLRQLCGRRVLADDHTVRVDGNTLATVCMVFVE